MGRTKVPQRNDAATLRRSPSNSYVTFSGFLAGLFHYYTIIILFLCVLGFTFLRGRARLVQKLELTFNICVQCGKAGCGGGVGSEQRN